MGGALRLFHVRGVPVELHWSALLLLLAAFRYRENALAQLVALLVIVLVHELGHAWLVWRYQLKVLAIRIYAFGGECSHEPTPYMRQQVVIAWGGVLAQAALCVVATVLLRVGLPLHASLRDMLVTFATSNVAIAAFNLLPIAPLDGHKAWRLKYLWPLSSGRRKGRPLTRTGAKPLVSLVDDALERARADSDAARAAERRAQRTKRRPDRD